MKCLDFKVNGSLRGQSHDHVASIFELEFATCAALR